MEGDVREEKGEESEVVVVGRGLSSF